MNSGEISVTRYSCSKEATRARTCQFRDVDSSPYFLGRDGNWYCYFHAPLDAVGNDGTSKEKFSKEEKDRFNRRVLDIIENRLTAPPPPDKFAEKSGRARIILTYLENWARDGITNLAWVIFPGPIKWDSIKLNDADFSACTFAGSVELNTCQFNGRTRFSFAQFKSYAFMQECRFDENVDFSHCRFDYEINLHGSIFGGKVDFSHATSSQMTHLCWREKKRRDDSDSLIPSLDLSEGSFQELVCLKNREFGAVKLDGATFRRAPDLTNVAVPDGTHFATATFDDISADARQRYTILNKLAMGAGDKLGADRFRALTFRTQIEDQNLSYLYRTGLGIYGLVSKFGTSLTRPLVSILVLNAIAIVLYSAFEYSQSSDLTGAAKFGLLHALRQTFKPFDPMSAIDEVLSSSEDGLRFVIGTVSVLHTALGAALLAAFAHSTYRTFLRD